MSLVELRPSASRAGTASAAAPVLRERAASGTRWWALAAIAAVAACAIGALFGTVVLNGDGLFHLVWGRALAEGELASFATGPTPHPSLLLLGAGSSVLGDDGAYLVTYLLFGPLAFGALVASAYEVARRLSSPLAGAIAAVIVATSPGVLASASAARYDIAFAALVMTAIALEMARPRRGLAPLACLALAGLIRPEAWLLAGAYWLFVARPLSWRARARTAALVAVAPVAWVLMDVLVMGDPLYSLHATDAASEGLYGQFSPWENLEAAGRNVARYLGVVPLAALAPAAFLLLRDRPSRALPLLAALAVTAGAFLVFVAQGMASSERYLLVPVCALAVLAATAVDGAGRRTPRRAALGVFLGVFLVLALPSRTETYGDLRGDVTRAERQEVSARALIAAPGVQEALRSCPAVSIPGGRMRHWFAYYAGRAPEAFTVDGQGRTRPDLYVAPANATVASDVLTRARFDADPTFVVPANLRPGPRSIEWLLYVSPTAGCTRGLR